jgi:hypothetical protein
MARPSLKVSTSENVAILAKVGHLSADSSLHRLSSPRATWTSLNRPDVDTTAPIPASVVLQRLHDQAPTDHFTLGWLLTGLSKHSFGVLLLLLSVIAIAPGASIVAGMLLLIPASEMIVGRPSPAFPDGSLPAPCRRRTSPPWCSAPYRC